MKERKYYNKYLNSNTPEKLAEKRVKSEEDIIAARSGEACDRFVALHRFKEEYAQRKKQRLLEEVKNIELLI